MADLSEWVGILDSVIGDAVEAAGHKAVKQNLEQWLALIEAAIEGADDKAEPES